MYWLWGILLGIVLTAALPLIAGVLSTSDRLLKPEESMLVAVALIQFCLLGVLIFKPAAGSRAMRIVRGRSKEDLE